MAGRQVVQQKKLTTNTITVLKSADLSAFSYSKARQQYAKNGKSKITVEKYRLGKAPLRFYVEGRVTTNGINVSEFGEGKNKKQVFTLGFLADEDEEFHGLLNAMNDSLLEYIDEDERDEYTLNQIVKDDKIYLKLKMAKNNKAFDLQTNVVLNPKRIRDADISQDQMVGLTAEIAAYFNLEDQKAGLTITPISLHFFQDDGRDDTTILDTPCPASKKAKTSHHQSLSSDE